MPRDDLGKVARNIKVIMHDHMIRNFNNNSPKADRLAFQEVLRDLGKETADELIKFGNAKHFSDEIFEHMINEHYLSKSDLEHHAQKSLASINRDPDLLFIDSLAKGAQTLLRKYRTSPTKYQRTLTMLEALVDSTLEDVLAIRALDNNTAPKVQQALQRHSNSTRNIFQKERLQEVFATHIHSFLKTIKLSETLAAEGGGTLATLGANKSPSPQQITTMSKLSANALASEVKNSLPQEAKQLFTLAEIKKSLAQDISKLLVPEVIDSARRQRLKYQKSLKQLSRGCLQWLTKVISR